MSNIISRSSSAGLSSFDDLDRLFDDLWQSFTLPNPSKNMLSADIYSEDDKHMIIELAAPGFNQNNIEINVRNGMLEISGERSEKEKQDTKRSYIARGSSASFVRRLALPEGVNTDNIAAELENGILKVTLPIERPVAKRIKIASPSSSNGAKKLTPKNANK